LSRRIQEPIKTQSIAVISLLRDGGAHEKAGSVGVFSNELFYGRRNMIRLQPVILTAALILAIRFLSACSGGSGMQLAITTSSLSDGTVGAAYNQTVRSSGGTAPYFWTLSAGSLPAGLHLGAGSASSVTVSGTPNAAQNSVSFTIQVTDSKNHAATQHLSLNIKNPPGPTISMSPAAPAATVTVPYAFTFAATGGQVPLVWSETGDLPAGLSFTNSGILSGKPAASGSFPINITVTDNVQQTNTIPVLLVVNDSGVSFSRLSGHYALLFQGHRPQNGLPFAAAAGFVADGAGGINNGRIEMNGAGREPSSATFTGTYSFDSADQGQLEIKNTAAGLDMVFRFVTLGPAGAPAAAVRLTEFDPDGTGSALMQLQDTCQFIDFNGNSNISGDYIFGLAGSLADGERIGAAGRFTADGDGGATNEKMDINVVGTTTSDADFTLNYSIGKIANTSCSGNATMGVSLGGVAVILHFRFFVVSPTEAFLISSDTATDSVPFFAGATAQQTGGPFSNSSMKGNFVYALTGVINSGENMGLQDVNVGFMTADGSGGFKLAGDENSVGTISTPQFSGTYNVAANGRVSITGEAEAPVLYLSGDIGFIVGTDSNASSGTFQKQTDDPVLKANLGGAPPLFSGFQGTAFAWNFTSITAFSGGSFFGNWDVGIPFYYPQTGIAFTGTYTIAANGRGLFNPGNPYQQAFYIVDKNTFVVVDSIGTIDTHPGLEIAACQETGAAGFGTCP
jgi:hypothetical protein